jgi:DNA invertase Pin-like site-specific DNA recombinase
MTVEKSTVETELKTAVIYLRVSTREQATRDGHAEGFSIPAQREALHKKAESMGIEIVAEFTDAGESAKSADRPHLQRMLQYLKLYPTDYVLVHKVDRLARNRKDDVEITFAIRAAGARLISATENIDDTPSGTLMHGVMSSIAEFYSNNLANEVHKGMSQKVKAGGTTNRAPLGYLNVGRLTSEGREERTVEVDLERAELISWAFTEFATGKWTLRALTEEIGIRGLMTRRTPKQPSRALRPSMLHSLLTNPYYKGYVTYQGIAHPGRHRPLTNETTWQRVQEVLASHAVGEKQRTHAHYLKSSVFCGDCGSRLMITNAKNRHGTIYPYFTCIGRHQKRTDCTRKAMLITDVERAIEDYWSSFRLDPAVSDGIEKAIAAELEAMRIEVAAERRQLQRTRTELEAKRGKLLEAFYNNSVTTDLIATEERRITEQFATVEERLTATAKQHELTETNIDYVVQSLRRGQIDYMAADHSQRRLLNQVFFTHLYIYDEDSAGLSCELSVT